MSLRTAADLERVEVAERWRRIRRIVVVEVLVMGWFAGCQRLAQYGSASSA
ncbi:hypothetical protein N6Q81_35295 [Streptomyces vinaceusdrappus]|uniref:Transposase n=1 Tax=Streptomyces vinaceusdrappus TaxID=67376 RepID=A0ABY6C4M6_9ACTN|nr:hypothetical protein [Streptomyces vinaceusdrappus]UXI82943.1 hypothetical protein N6Q81_35295 [Streptomyces vinaceusdrappus]